MEVQRRNTIVKLRKIVALVGMTGAGKTEAAQYLSRRGLAYLRFGQLIVDEARRRGGVGEKYERPLRGEFRKKYGMAALAKLNLPRLQRLLQKSSVVIDDLYSWEEYKFLRQKFGQKRVVLVAICASPTVRYARLTSRHFDKHKDKLALYRAYSPREAEARDFNQVEKQSQGGPIAMANYFVVNEKSAGFLRKALRKVLVKEGLGQ